MAKRKPKSVDESKVITQTGRLDEKQIVTDVTPDEIKDTKSKQQYKPADSAVKKNVLKTDIASTLARDTKGVASIDGANPTPGIGVLRALSYSGNDEASFASSLSSTPNATGSTRSDTRSGKRVDTTLRAINDIISEQAFFEVDMIPSLAKSGGSEEGYNGTRRSRSALIQKTSGGHISSPSFSRSLDMIHKDQIVFTHGQHVNIGNAFSPRLFRPQETTGADGTVVGLTDNNLVRGNYIPRALNITISPDGVLTDFTFDVDDISTTIPAHEQEAANKTNTNVKRLINKMELVRQDIEAKAGDENKEGWSPLARVVPYPTATISYAHDLESDAGNTMYTAYNALSNALAYQINLTAKDGANPTRAMREMVLNGLIANPEFNSTHLDDINPFGAEAFEAAAATLFIAAFDSTAKYDSKAQLLTLPKSFKQVLPIAEKHSGGIKVSEEFAKVYSNVNVGGTIDHEYDPLAPVFMIDRNLLVHPFDWNEQVSRVNGVDIDYNIGYLYFDSRNRYVTVMNNFMLQGIRDYLSEYASNFRRAYDTVARNDRNARFGADDDLELSIPIFYSNTTVSLWTLLVLASSRHIQLRRLAAMREFIDYTNNHGYPFSDLIDASSVLTGGSRTIGFRGIEEPLVFKKLDTISAMTFTHDELFIMMDEGSGYNSYLLPWYMSENEYENTADGFHINREAAAISVPIVRSGITTSTVDATTQLDSRNLRLSVDRLIVPFNLYETDDADEAALAYKYDAGTDGLIILPLTEEQATIGSLLSSPRQFGYVMPAPAFYAFASPLTGRRSTLEDVFLGETSYRARAYYASTNDPLVINEDTGPETTINNPDEITHVAGANYRQDWVISFAAITDHYHRVLNGIPLGFSALFVDNTYTVINDADATELTTIPGVSLFRPVVEADGLVGRYEIAKSPRGAHNVVSIATAMWFRINMLPFLVSPWDTALSRIALGEEDANKFDPYDFAYMFGLAGFAASDYTQAVETRNQQMDEEGLYFINDPWLAESTLLR